MSLVKEIQAQLKDICLKVDTSMGRYLRFHLN